MAFSPPVFNVFADCWYGSHTPAHDDPDAENLTVQLYINPRAPFSIDDPFFQVFDYPATFVRSPADADATWREVQIFEIPAESGNYYKARFKDIMHLGFPNEYRITSVAQCDEHGIPISRYIFVEPVDHSGAGGGDTNGSGTPDGQGSGGTGTPTEHHGFGEPTQNVATVPMGEGTQS